MVIPSECKRMAEDIMFLAECNPSWRAELAESVSGTFEQFKSWLPDKMTLVARRELNQSLHALQRLERQLNGTSSTSLVGKRKRT